MTARVTLGRMFRIARVLDPHSTPTFRFLTSDSSLATRRPMGVDLFLPEHMLAFGSGGQITKHLSLVFDAALVEMQRPEDARWWRRRQQAGLEPIIHRFYRGHLSHPAIVWCHLVSWSKALSLKAARQTELIDGSPITQSFDDNPVLPMNPSGRDVVGAQELLRDVTWHAPLDTGVLPLLRVSCHSRMRGLFDDPGWTCGMFRSYTFPCVAGSAEFAPWIKEFLPPGMVGRVYRLQGPIGPTRLAYEAPVSGETQGDLNLELSDAPDRIRADGAISDTVVLKFTRCIPMQPYRPDITKVERIGFNFDRATGRLIAATVENEVDVECPNFESTALGSIFEELLGSLRGREAN